MTQKYAYLKAGHWESCQDGTKSVVSSNSVLTDDNYGSGCTMSLLFGLVILVMVIGLWLYIV